MTKFAWMIKDPIVELAQPLQTIENAGMGADELAFLASEFDSGFRQLQNEYDSRQAPAGLLEKYREISELFTHMDEKYGFDVWKYGATAKFSEWLQVQKLAREICALMSWDYKEYSQ